MGGARICIQIKLIIIFVAIGSLHCDVAERSGDSPTVAPSKRSTQKLVAGRGVAEGSAVSAHRGLVLLIVSFGHHSAVIVFN